MFVRNKGGEITISVFYITAISSKGPGSNMRHQRSGSGRRSGQSAYSESERPLWVQQLSSGSKPLIIHSKWIWMLVSTICMKHKPKSGVQMFKLLGFVQIPAPGYVSKRHFCTFFGRIELFVTQLDQDII